MPVFDNEPQGNWLRLRNRFTREHLGQRVIRRDDAWQNALLPETRTVCLPLPGAHDTRTIFWWDEMPLPFYCDLTGWHWQSKDEYRAELRRILDPWLLTIEDPTQAERRAKANAERQFLDANVTLMLPGSIYCSKPLPIVDFIVATLCDVISLDYALIDQFMPIRREQIVSALRPFAKVDIYLTRE